MPRLALLIAGLLVFVGFLIAVGALIRGQRHEISARDAARAGSIGCRAVERAYAAHDSDIWLTLAGTVVRLLPDTDGRYRHQRFIVRCPSGRTVLIVNDVSIGQRVPVVAGGSV